LAELQDFDYDEIDFDEAYDAPPSASGDLSEERWFDDEEESQQSQEHRKDNMEYDY
jgi:hypothetical protein